MAIEAERLDLRSLDIAAEKRQELLSLLPEVQTEGGRIDFERLRLALGDAVDAGKERYGLTWPGKAECFTTVQAPSLGTLLPCREEGVNFDETENVFIEGDNLEVLKLLQKSYMGRIKMIYIDPPYNTGNEFIYPDDYAESLHTYLQYTGQIDAEGRKFGTNNDTSGRFHSKWLTMMWPRLYLARNLLADDGAIFVSIADHEVANLRCLMNELFGEENFVATIIWQKVYAAKNSAKHLSEDHDYVVLYAKNADLWSRQLLPRTDAMEARYINPDNDPRGRWKPDNLTARNYYSKGIYPITCPSGRVIPGPPSGSYYRVSPERFKELDEDRRIWWGVDGNNNPALKRFLSEVMPGRVPQTLWFYQDVGHTQDAKKDLLAAVKFEQTDNVLDTVKPTGLIRRMLQIATTPNDSDIVLDFFAGSGTTGDAVYKQNESDGGNRRFICVQLPEPLPLKESKLETLCDIAKERLRSAGKALASASATQLALDAGQKDSGFKVFKLAESNLVPWDGTVNHTVESVAQQMKLHVEHIREGRSDEDILYEVLLKMDFPLTAPIKKLQVAGKSVYSVYDGALLACLELGLSLELMRALADMDPERILCLDDGFAGNDQLKANAAQLLKARNITFRTV